MIPIKILSDLNKIGGQYAVYYAPAGAQPDFRATGTRFISASMIKVPILLAWLHLEREGLVSRAELCDLDQEPQVQGAGFSWLLRGRQIPYQDVLLLMIAVSDNLCTNLVIRRAGIERLNRVFRDGLGLHGTELQRKLFDLEARERGLDNWISPEDCIRLYQCVAELCLEERKWVESVLAVNQDALLLMRDIPIDALTFHHKTGAIHNIALHDWGYTETCQMFLLTQNLPDESAAYPIFGALGRLLME